MSYLPNDVILIISSYYGNKIVKELSDEINDQKLLYAIKEKEYYNKQFRTWHTNNVGNILCNEQNISNKLKTLYRNALWKDKDKIINKMWHSLSSNDRVNLVEKNFKYAFNDAQNTKFITFTEFFYDNFGYYLVNN
jgi:hypothetical protein